MKALIIGSGGREHALAWRIAQSPRVKTLYCAPGNPGMAVLGPKIQIVNLMVDDLDGLLAFAQKESIDLTVVGPEYPLTLGIVDRFQSAGLRIVGPSKVAAQIEGSKSFAKDLMKSARVPTAAYEVFTDRTRLAAYVETQRVPLVLKADGLAAGKGVFVCHSKEEVQLAIAGLCDELKADRIVVEEFLQGKEASLIVATDGEHIYPLAPAHDYKRIRDRDEGPNTGGMGTLSPTPHLTPQQEKQALETIVAPVVRKMAEQGMPFRGFLYAGLMVGSDGRINCLEFNARLGDPECQVIMRRMRSDFFEFLLQLTEPGGPRAQIEWNDQTAICVVIAAEGYPEKPRRGDEIHGLNLAANIPDVIVFHSGTALQQGKVVTAGGRVLSVTALGADLAAARHSAYKACDMIQFKGRQHRRDIGL